MDRPHKTNHGLIEYMLSLLNLPPHCSDSDDHPLSQVKTSEAFPLSEFSYTHTALEVKAFMDQMPGGFFIYQADGKEELLYANKAMLRIFNCDTMEEFRELTGNSFRGIVHPDDLEEVEKSIQEQIAHSQHDLDYVEYRIIQKGGTIRWIEDYGHFIHSETAGDIFYVFAGDATEKRQRQEAEHLQRLEVIEGLSINYESILYINLDINKVLPYRLSGRTEKQFGKTFQLKEYDWFVSEYVKLWVYEEDRPLMFRALNPDYIRSKLADSRTFYVNYRVLKDEELQYLQLRIVDVSNAGQASRIVLGCRRIDEEIQHEIEQKKIFEDAWNHARLANITKDTFLSNMSHDMRTPLNAISGYTAVAKNYVTDPEKILDYLEKIESSSENLLHIINDILEISRLESGTIQMEESECRISDLVKEVHEALLPRARSKSIIFSTDLSGIEHDHACCDCKKLIQILSHLVSNAIKYTEQEGQVRITVTERPETASEYSLYYFSVKDNGIGIDEKNLECIFEPFERISNTTFCGVPGTGLGLTIARYLAEMMGGHLEVQSALGIGSRFTVSLTLRSLHILPPVRSQEALIQYLKGKKILLVDDNEINLEVEAALLEDYGFSVDLAFNGRAAVDKIVNSVSGEYALILMDIQMPVMNGHEATRAIRRLPDPALAQIPIIALSANCFEEDRQNSLKSGMNAHMAKPFDPAKFLELTAGILQF